jgi:YidC/Oxa1 family membrane protein insertase
MLTALFTNILVALVVWLPGHSLAAAIIVFTLALRFALMIPNKKALESSRKIQQLQPQIDEVRKTITDQQAQAKALMELYQKNNINPLGSCFPLLIQLPLLIVFFNVLRSGFGDRAYDLLYSFVPRPEFINTGLWGIDLTLPDTTLILPILAAGLQLIQTFFMIVAAKKRGQNMPGSGMLLALSIMTFFIGKGMNAGVVLYWVTQTAFGLVQQVQVEREKLKVVGVKELDLPDYKKALASPQETKSSKGGVEVTVRRPGQK